MTGTVVLLYLAIGVGCGVIRLSAVAVGLIAMIPAVLGAYAASAGGILSMLAAALIALLVIECAYFITMLAIARPWSKKPGAETTETRKPVPSELHLPRKVGEEP
jgi:Mg2+/citrate symporter